VIDFVAAEVFAAALFAAQRAFVASDNRFRPAAVRPPLELFAAGFAEVLVDVVATEASAAGRAAFFAAALTARFFFAQRFCCANAIRWRASALITRFPVLAVFKAGLAAALEVGWETAVRFSASSAVIAAVMRSR
jgi:hypothetical protein